MSEQVMSEQENPRETRKSRSLAKAREIGLVREDTAAEQLKRQCAGKEVSAQAKDAA